MENIEGQVIADVRSLTGDVPEAFSWCVDVDDDIYIFELGDGSFLIPVSDYEGNGPGAWRGKGVNDWEELAGSLIDSIAPMSTDAMNYRDWDDQSGYRPPVITLDTEERFFPAGDPEGNQPGVLYRILGSKTFIVDFEQA
ncbi:hypothetical protein [Natrinema hispanicum]|uniref:Uncharacterized protein n=1 Tax=Natrinema hispanicum TaxID=392421 RepID=A0A1H9YNK5_9EURY|nr:hypothetical protein [Natrinema hispanicum]SES70649.1 hypothetical protein SAMN04488694_101181 [Natrinema hispanicum]